MRAHLISCFGSRLTELEAKLEELLLADEIFMTNVGSIVQHISQILDKEGKIIYQAKSKSQTQLLRKTLLDNLTL